jgi:hypothetical protein
VVSMSLLCVLIGGFVARYRITSTKTVGKTDSKAGAA